MHVVRMGKERNEEKTLVRKPERGEDNIKIYLRHIGLEMYWIYIAQVTDG